MNQLSCHMIVYKIVFVNNKIINNHNKYFGDSQNTS